MIGNCYEIYGFTPEEKFHVIAGIHTSPMIAGDENGDSFPWESKGRKFCVYDLGWNGNRTGSEKRK